MQQMSMSPAVHLTDIFCLQLWDLNQVAVIANNLLQSLQQSTFSIPKSTVNNLHSFSVCDSNRSSFNSSTFSEPGASNTEEMLHYASNVHLHPGAVDLILPESVAQLEHIIQHCQMTIGPGYRQALLTAFTDNSLILSSFFYGHDTPLILHESTKTSMNSSDLKDLDNKCIMLKISTEVLRLMFRQLCEQGGSFGEIKLDYFAQFAKSPIKKLLEIALSLSEAKWSASDICRMLLAYETLQDVLPIIRKFFSAESQEFFPRIFDNMRKGFKEIFETMKQFIQDNVNSRQDSAIHPKTRFLICSMQFFSCHKHLVQSTLAPGDDHDSFGYLLNGVITCWYLMLKEYSEIYNLNPGWRFIFLLNNIKHFSGHTDILLNDLYHGELIAQHKAKFENLEHLYDRYLSESWGPAKSCLDCNLVGRRIHRSMVAFNSKFNDTFDCQNSWKVPDCVVRQKLRNEIEMFIWPAYKSSFEELQTYSVSRLCSCLRRDIARDLYTAETLRTRVRGLFEG